MALLCIPVYAQGPLTTEEVINTILSYHNIETNVDITNYLTLGAETMTREVAVTAVVRSFGIYPVNEPNYIWKDEEYQDIKYQSYIDYAKRMGITNGVKENYFFPNKPITRQELNTMLQRASDAQIEPVYEMIYVDPLYKILSADFQYGLSLCPEYLIDKYYKEEQTITASTDPITMPNGSHISQTYAGIIYYDKGIWLITLNGDEPYKYQSETIIHEIGHFLGYKTKLIDRTQVSEELNWLIHFYRQYCNTNNSEFFADSFVAYIFWNEEMKENMPITYQHMQECIEKINDYYETVED